jgi:hypothetical protein
MNLDYLDFDYSEDAAGWGSFDALASTLAAHHPAVLAQVQAVLDWANSAFAGQRAPLDEGGEWDHALQVLRERPGTAASGVDTDRYNVSFVITGTPAFCTAFRERFGLC